MISAKQAQYESLKAARARMGMYQAKPPVVRIPEKTHEVNIIAIKNKNYIPKPTYTPDYDCSNFINKVPDELYGFTQDNNQIHIYDIQNIVCDYYNITKIDILSQRRTLDVVHCRQLAMYLARTHTIHSLPIIGKHFGGRDHTTVLHAVDKIEKLIQINGLIKLKKTRKNVRIEIKALEKIMGVISPKHKYWGA